MCIFSGEVAVSGTSILVAAAQNGTRQFTAYQNFVTAKEKNNNAMILPFPLVEGEKLDLIDLSKYKDLFKNCKNSFNDSTMRSSGSRSSNFLEVQQVGGYKVSVANNIGEILKINPSVFTLPKDIHELLSKHYSKGFAFAICLFDSTVKDEHAIAFEHSIIGKNQLYVPTRHEHGDKNQKKMSCKKLAFFQGELGKYDEKEEEITDFAGWDHNIYSVNTVNGGESTPKMPVFSPEKIFEKLPKEIDAMKSFHRLEIHGNVANTDLIIKLA
eukprot:gene4867-8461_t